MLNRFFGQSIVNLMEHALSDSVSTCSIAMGTRILFPLNLKTEDVTPKSFLGWVGGRAGEAVFFPV